MTGNLVEGWGEIIRVIASIAILVAFAVALPQSGGSKTGQPGPPPQGR
ncbi:MAG: hypothetical protein ACOH2M_20195 [Cypionkella sp.]